MGQPASEWVFGTSGLRSDALSIEQPRKGLKDSREVLGTETWLDLDGRLLMAGVHTACEEGQIRDCTEFCTDPLHLALTGRYCSLRGGWWDVAEEKDKRFIIRDL
jgi:hypothetical protein